MRGSSILITGGTGTFGEAFARYALNEGASRVVCFSRCEVRQAEMAEKLNDRRMRYFIGDVRDKDRLVRAFQDVDTVIHAAALKRIEVGQYNPTEMVKTNVIGAMNVVEAAQVAGVKRVVALSTDKAYQPISPYGHSKALAEAIFLNANNTSGKHGPDFTVTRYGNIAFSRGSVIPKWKKLIAEGKEITITNSDCTRFWMTIDQAVDLVREAINLMPVYPYIPSLKAYRLADLAVAMGGANNFRITGLPEWEKLHESLDDGDSSDVAPRMSIEDLRGAVDAWANP